MSAPPNSWVVEGPASVGMNLGFRPRLCAVLGTDDGAFIIRGTRFVGVMLMGRCVGCFVWQGSRSRQRKACNVLVAREQCVALCTTAACASRTGAHGSRCKQRFFAALGWLATHTA